MTLRRPNVSTIEHFDETYACLHACVATCSALRELLGAIVTRHVLAVLIGLFLLVPRVAVAQLSAPEPMIGLVEFDGADGALVTAAFKEELASWDSLGKRRSPIRLIERARYQAALEKSGSEEKAAAIIGTELGVDLVTIGSVAFTVENRPFPDRKDICVERDEANSCKRYETRTRSCVETKGILRFTVRTIEVKSATGPDAGIIEKRDNYLTCDGIVQPRRPDFGLVMGLFASRPSHTGPAPNSVDSLKADMIGTGVSTLLFRLSRSSRKYGELASISGSTIDGNTTINAQTAMGALAIGMNASASATQGAIGSVGAGQQMTEPPFFPWPPPAPSLLGEVTSNFRIGGDLAAINKQIGALLNRRGYDSLHYFGIEGGFVVTTDLERYGENGRPATRDRWLIGKSGRARSFTEYVGNLLFGEKGRFRMFAFIVGSRDPGAAPFIATEQDTQRWKVTGAVALSASTGARPVAPGTRVWLYVYEFENSLDKNSKIVPLTDHAVPLVAHKRSLGLQ